MGRRARKRKSRKGIREMEERRKRDMEKYRKREKEEWRERERRKWEGVVEGERERGSLVTVCKLSI